eukprot:TRINITY_DN101_c0_g1_i3.p1 TRINITY_DN101_c0_g1~~TRINITY_DN101_c0_g1_i3.p1  ORF type:complete len:849 (+),score=23.95 TRINITY_DN101_c0_g1_i3:2314-4860(+)
MQRYEMHCSEADRRVSRSNVCPREQKAAALHQNEERTHREASTFLFNPKQQFGAILCDDSLKVLGFTSKVSKLLNVSERVLVEIINKTSLDYLFPEASTEKGLEQLQSSAGVVLKFKSKNFLTESVSEDFIRSAKTTQTLLWCRVIQERYSEGQSVLIFLFSPIPSREFKHFYRTFLQTRTAQETRQAGFIIDARRKISPACGGNKQRKGRKTRYQIKFIARRRSMKQAQFFGRRKAYPDHSKVSLTACIRAAPSSPLKWPRSCLTVHFLMKLLLLSRNWRLLLQQPSLSQFLFQVLILLLFNQCIVVDTYITEKEASTLQEYFSLGYAYESRYKHALIIYGNIVTYNDTRYGNSKETYEMSYLRLMYSLTRLTRRNVHIRKGFSARKLDYDSKMVTITDKGQAFAVTFSHAMIKVCEIPFNLQLQLINYCVNLLEFGSYEELVSVSMNPKNTLLIENLAAVEYIASSMLKPMRNYQDKYSEVLRHEIEVVSTQGEKSLYILIGSCAAAALVSIGLVFPVFIWIIKDKSCVIAIFADITEEEIKAITENIENFDIRNVVVKNRWVRACDGNEDKFWKKVIKCQGKDNDKENPSNKPKTPEASSPSAIVGSEKPLAKNVPKVIDKQEDNKENAELDLAKIDLKDIAELEATKKRMARRDHLSKLEQVVRPVHNISSKLRNTAILRLSIVLCVFLIYGGTSSYLNYYFHRINKSTTSHLYVLLKRSIYLPTMTAMISRSVLSGDKTFVVDPSIIFCKIRIVDYPSVLDGNDIIRKMQVIESEIKRYERDGNRGIFKEYFKWSHLLDTDEFCSIVDAQRTPQSESMTYGGDFIVECANLYSGPAGHGLSDS